MLRVAIRKNGSLGRRTIIWADELRGKSRPRGRLSPILRNVTYADRAALYQIRAIALFLPRLPARHERDPQSGRLGRLQAREHRGAGDLEPGGLRRAGPEVFPQGRRPGAPEEGRGERRPVLAVALRARRGGPRRPPRGPAPRLRDLLQAGLRPPRRLLDLLGLEGRLLLLRGGCPGLLSTSCASCSPTRWWRRTRRNGSTPACTGPTASTGPSQGHYLRGLQDRQADQVQVVLRAPAAACLLHPGRRGRPGERGRHHGPVGARGAPVQVRLRHRLQLLQAARRGREALRRRPLVRPDELPQDRRPGRRRDQVGRHHAPRRQDGGGRRRSPGHREPTSTGR